MKIATLRSDLARVLFSPGVHHLRDPRCGVRNFGESLDAIPKAQEFAAERTPTYVPPSQHQVRSVSVLKTVWDAATTIHVTVRWLSHKHKLTPIGAPGPCKPK
jgi:hypothetical protein